MGFVAVTVHSGVRLSPGAAAGLVRYARRRSGRAVWDGVSLELFCGGRETLVIARPSPEVRIADYALPFLRKYGQK